MVFLKERLWKFHPNMLWVSKTQLGTKDVAKSWCLLSMFFHVNLRLDSFVPNEFDLHGSKVRLGNNLIYFLKIICPSGASCVVVQCAHLTTCNRLFLYFHGLFCILCESHLRHYWGFSNLQSCKCAHFDLKIFLKCICLLKWQHQHMTSQIDLC